MLLFSNQLPGRIDIHEEKRVIRSCWADHEFYTNVFAYSWCVNERVSPKFCSIQFSDFHLNLGCQFVFQSQIKYEYENAVKATMWLSGLVNFKGVLETQID